MKKHVLPSCTCTCILGRHGSACLPRVEREKKMAATYNVLMSFRQNLQIWLEMLQKC